MGSYGYIKSDSEFYYVFGVEPVPIRSIVPVVPREAGCPLCYVVQTHKLTQAQLNTLAEKLYWKWQPECLSIKEALTCILANGLPLKTEHFSSVGTSDFFQIPWGAALNIAAHMSENQKE